MARAYIVGTLDTKGAELLYIRDLLAAAGVQACVVDVGTGKGGRVYGAAYQLGKSPTDNPAQVGSGVQLSQPQRLDTDGSFWHAADALYRAGFRSLRDDWAGGSTSPGLGAFTGCGEGDRNRNPVTPAPRGGAPILIACGEFDNAGSIVTDGTGATIGLDSQAGGGGCVAVLCETLTATGTLRAAAGVAGSESGDPGEAFARVFTQAVAPPEAEE